MSGQPLKTPSDATKYRSEYMQSLALQSKINDVNAKANQLFLETGQLPPSTQMADTRPTSEKLLDSEFLKQSIVKDLQPVAEPYFGLRIVQGIEKSPLNVDNSFLKWVAQNGPEITKTLQLNYKFGIAGDENDADTLVQKLTSIYADTKNSLKSVKSYMNSTVSTNPNGPRGVLSQNDFDGITANLNNFIKDLRTIQGKNYSIEFYRPIEDLMSKLMAIKNIIPTTEMISFYVSNISKPSTTFVQSEGGDTFEIDNVGLTQYFDTLEKLPKMNIVMSLIDACRKAIKPFSKRTLTSAMNSLTQLFSSFTPEVIAELRGLKSRLFERAQEQLDYAKHIQSNQIAESIRQDEHNDRLARKAERVYVINPQSDAVWTRQAPAGRLGGPWGDDGYDDPQNHITFYDTNPPPFSDTPSSISSLSDDILNQGGGGGSPSYISDIGSDMSFYSSHSYDTIPSTSSSISDKGYIHYPPGELTGPRGQQVSLPPAPPIGPGYPSQGLIGNPSPFIPKTERQEIINRLKDPKLPQELRKQLERRLGQIDQENEPPPLMTKEEFDVQQGKSGTGIKRRGRIRGSGVVSVPKPPTFVGFGINEINQRLLDKNILSIRRDTRSKIKNMQNRHVSEGMKRTLQKIIGGGVPDYNDLSGLPEEEKDYLDKIVRASNLQDKLSIPAPSKDQREKDFHQFEVMRGEILSGNDNREMIKKFKLLCVRLMRQGSLPKAEVHELMEALADLGL
jgi:hypothetical protein